MDTAQPSAPQTASQTAIQTLSALGDLRVWSVIITIFGDAVMPRGGKVSATVLATLTDRLGIKPEALRVALFRLGKDGWITRSKQGRNSYYSLTKRGRETFLPASRRIYAKAPALAGPWHIAALGPDTEAERALIEETLTQAGYIRLTPLLFLGAGNVAYGPDAPGQDALVISGILHHLPNWARAALAPDSLQQDYIRLETALLWLRDQPLPSAPETAAALRVLLVHQWRRMLLRHADLPPDVLPDLWRGEACRALVLDLYQRLSDPADQWLDANI
jgi:phenylacetic acid degradation operon negative regulatory protein